MWNLSQPKTTASISRSMLAYRGLQSLSDLLAFLKRDGLPVLNENSAESSAGGVDLDDTLSLWVEVRKGHFTTDERLRRFKRCVVRFRPDELGVLLH